METTKPGKKSKKGAGNLKEFIIILKFKIESKIGVL